MAATTNYGQTIPTVGGDNDTWGTTNNALWNWIDGEVANRLVQANNVVASIAAASASAAFTAEEIIAGTALGGVTYKLSSFSKTVNLASTGAGAMDTGAAPNNGFVSVYAIVKADGTQSILACNVTTSSDPCYTGANKPSGYVGSCLLAVLPTNGSGQFKVGYVRGRTVRFAPASVLSTTASALSSFSSLSLTAVPTVAKSLLGFGAASKSGGGNLHFRLAPDSAGVIYQQHGQTDSSGAGTPDSYHAFECPIFTAQTVYYSGDTGISLVLYANGYTF